MNQGKLAHRLKEFYILETFQVKYYSAQLSTSPDEYYRKAFDKMVSIESEHVDYFAQKLVEEGIELPQIVEPVFKMAGKLLGESVEFTGPFNTLRLGIKLESRAIEKYRYFILKGWGDQGLREKLMDHLLDEEYHTLWMQDYLRHLFPAPNSSIGFHLFQ